MRRIHTTEDQAGIYKSQVISTEAEMVRGFSLQPYTPPSQLMNCRFGGRASAAEVTCEGADP